jgi:hypothetical protein
VLAAAPGGMSQWAWPRIAAVYVIVVTPGIIAFAFAQRLFFRGLMEACLRRSASLDNTSLHRSLRLSAILPHGLLEPL